MVRDLLFELWAVRKEMDRRPMRPEDVRPG
jgi:hypothetical protein